MDGKIFLKQTALVAWIGATLIVTVVMVIRGVNAAIEIWQEEGFEELVYPAIIGGLAGLGNVLTIRAWLRSREQRSPTGPPTNPQ